MDFFDSLLDSVDISFKYILLSLNFFTIIFVYIFKSRNKKPREHNVLFITAHPDDEVMFFRPTIKSLRENYFVHVLCLSGKDTPRQSELILSCNFLGVDEVRCLNDPKLVDGMKQKWCEETIRQYATQYINEKNIKAIFTFDRYGISNHLNHISIHNALKQLESKESSDETIKIYYLQSVYLLRKYSNLLQIPIALLRTFSWIQISPFHAYKAISFHKSQLVWYRKLWVILSRYQYINTYKRGLVKVKCQKNEEN